MDLGFLFSPGQDMLAFARSSARPTERERVAAERNSEITSSTASTKQSGN